MIGASTALLPLAAQKAVVVGIAGLAGWPFLLNGLLPRYFPWLDAEARAELRSIVQLDDQIFGKLGGWVADAQMLLMLARRLLSSPPETVVEFGSGISTVVAAQCLKQNGRGHLITHDHHSAFAQETAQRLKTLGLEADVRAAPLSPHIADRNGWAGAWYDTEDLPHSIDLLIVDGPPWFLHPLIRGNAACLFHRISHGGAVILDDAARPGERLIASRWRREHPDFDFHYMPTRKGALLGIRR